MGKKKRVYKSLLGIPIWFIAGLALFILFSAIYDFMVLDRSTLRYIVIISASLILIITIGFQMISLNSVKKIATRQMGGN